MLESFREFGPSPEASTFDGALGAVQHTCGILDRPAFEVDEHDGCSLVGGQRRQSRPDLAGGL